MSTAAQTKPPSDAVGGHVGGFGAGRRTDRWWVGPVLTFGGLMAFIVYATWAAFQGDHFWAEPYLSPFYSPVLFMPPSSVELSMDAHGLPKHVWLADSAWPAWWPSFLPPSPAFLILIFPGVFRFTCYYYRKAYYRSFAGAPVACGVEGVPQKNYRGETFLMAFQNLHRYALYFALAFLFILAYDAIHSFFREGQFGIGVGSIILTINVVLLTCFTCGCHAFRHLVGGRLDCFSCDKGASVRHGVWSRVTCLNQRHMLFAWLSLFWVGLADLYVRLVSMGIVRDLNTWNG